MPNRFNQLFSEFTYLRQLRWLHFLLLRLHRFFLRWKKSVLFSLIFIVLSAVYLAQEVQIAVRTEDFSDPKLKSYQAMLKLKEDYSFEDRLSLVIKKNSPFNQNEMCKIQRWLQNEVNSNLSVVSSSSVFDLRGVHYNPAKKTLIYPQIIPDPCLHPMDEVKIKAHPLLNMFMAPDLSDLIVHFEIRPEEIPLQHGIYDYEKIFDIIESAKKQLPFKVYAGGTLFLQASILEGAMFANILNLVAATLLFVGYFYFYRSFIMAFGLLGVILVTTIIIQGGMSFFGHKIDPITSSIFLMIMVAILEDFILMSHTLFKKKLSYNAAIKSLLLPSFLTSMTTAIGFGSLMVSDNPSIVNFGLWTAFGALFEWVSLFLIIPVLVNFFPKIKRRLEAHPQVKQRVPKNLISYTPGLVATVLIAIIPFMIFLTDGKGNLDDNPLDLMPPDHEISQYRNHVQKTRQMEGDVSIVFHDKNIDLKPFIEKIRRDPLVSATYSDVEIGEMFSLTPDFLHKLIYLDFNRTPLGKLFSSSENKRIIASIKSYNSNEIPLFEARLKEICGVHCRVVSEVIVSNDYALGILKTLYESFFSGYFFIMILISWLVMAIKRRYMVPVLISAVWASLTLLLILIIFQVKINIITCVALSVLVGAAGDNAIQFLLLKRETLYHSVQDLGEASSQTFILMIGVSSTLFFSYFQQARDLSYLLIGGILLMFIGDVWILSGLAALRDRLGNGSQVTDETNPKEKS